MLAMLMVLPACNRSQTSDADDTQVITVFAAASLSDVLTTLAEQFQADVGIEVKCSFASSSTLARQIQSGAPADIFFSANEQWMDVLESDGLLNSDSRINLLGNTLVIIAPSNETFDFDAQSDDKLENAFVGRIALGDPDHVPAGRYAKQALVALDSWDALEDRAVLAGDVRGVLMFVERGEVAAGIVYATDARISAKVKVVAELPAELHDPIVYPAALTTDASASAQRFFNYLQSDAAAAVFREAGFVIRFQTP